MDLITKVKRLTIVAMFSDDLLLELLTLKGGNAIDLVHKVSSRASIDHDFSIQGDFPFGIEELQRRVERALVTTFAEHEIQVFDVKAVSKPAVISEANLGFWGGYEITFKIIGFDEYFKHRDDIDYLRKAAIKTGPKGSQKIDISKHEYTEPRQEVEFDYHRIYVYTPEMIVAEKLRALCQQTNEYAEIVGRSANAARARDFVDIVNMIETFHINMITLENMELVHSIFEAKQVPWSLLDVVETYYDLHETNFKTLGQTMMGDHRLKSFDFYFDRVISLMKKLKPFGNV